MSHVSIAVLFMPKVLTLPAFWQTFRDSLRVYDRALGLGNHQP